MVSAGTCWSGLAMSRISEQSRSTCWGSVEPSKALSASSLIAFIPYRARFMPYRLFMSVAAARKHAGRPTADAMTTSAVCGCTGAPASGGLDERLTVRVSGSEPLLLTEQAKMAGDEYGRPFPAEDRNSHQ